MGRTNARVKIYQRIKDYRGTQTDSSSPILVGEYDAWIEEHLTDDILTVYVGGHMDNMYHRDIPKGLCLIFTDINLFDCYMEYDSVTYEIFKYQKNMDHRSIVHHVEFYYG